MQAIYGINPIREFLYEDPASLKEIIIARGRRGRRDIEEICRLATAAGVTISVRDRSELDAIAGRVAHQGVIGWGVDFRYATVDEIMANRHPQMAGDLIVIVDEVTDPHNLGAIIRTAHCLGANGIVIPARRATEVTGTVLKASAGAARYLPVARETNVVPVIEQLKRHGYWIYAAEVGAEKVLEDMDFRGQVAIIVGGEGKGIRRLVREKADFLFSIPMVGKINSLNVSVATGIVLFKVFSSLRRTE